MKKALIFGSTLLISATPFIAFAQSGNLSNIATLVHAVGGILNLLIPILIVLAILAFFWGLIQYIQGGKGLSAGRNIMIAGLVSLFIMVSLWGVLGFIGASIGISTAGGTNAIPPPQVTGI